MQQSTWSGIPSKAAVGRQAHSCQQRYRNCRHRRIRRHKLRGPRNGNSSVGYTRQAVGAAGREGGRRARQYLVPAALQFVSGLVQPERLCAPLPEHLRQLLVPLVALPQRGHAAGALSHPAVTRGYQELPVYQELPGGYQGVIRSHQAVTSDYQGYTSSSPEITRSYQGVMMSYQGLSKVTKGYQAIGSYWYRKVG